MLKILIIDDEAPARNRLRRMLEGLPAVRVTGEAMTGLEALHLMPLMKPDVLLLDISMPGMDGMTLAQTLQQQDVAPAVIFCTAWSDQAVEAFDCDAVDYLVSLSVWSGSSWRWIKPAVSLPVQIRVRMAHFFVQH
jgi:two-component system response regulator AlgR